MTPEKIRGNIVAIAIINHRLPKTRPLNHSGVTSCRNVNVVILTPTNPIPIKITAIGAINNPQKRSEIIATAKIPKLISIIFFFLHLFLRSLVIKTEAIVAPIPAGTTIKRPTYAMDVCNISFATAGKFAVTIASPTCIVNNKPSGYKNLSNFSNFFFQFIL